MKIIREKVKIEFTSDEINIIEKMNDLADKFHIKNNLCTNYDCKECPFQAFCSDNMESVYLNIEKFLNNEDWR